jgi:Fe-S-cluster-containing dehydrogenase component
MAFNEMAILQDVDKCMRCNGCVVACKRTWKMKVPEATYGQNKTAPGRRMVIKSQKRVDMGPFTRYSCWHCENPPCVLRCPFKAVIKEPNGAVHIDWNLCKPGEYNDAGVKCIGQCQIDCGRGGYPKIGKGSDIDPGTKAWKCTLCFGRAGAGDVSEGGSLDATIGTPLPNKTRPALDGKYYSAISETEVPELEHQPACVYSCPAVAMMWDTRDNIRTYINGGTEGFISAQGDGSMYWASRKSLLIAPKADPFVEDHVTPLVSSVMSSPFAKAALVPTVFGAGLMALIARRQRLADEPTGEV